uniref:ABC transporter domain-containing protein n=1 Tax=Populus davidiana TaxID=266767 RepID=A0A6M2ELR9_9ROSI
MKVEESTENEEQSEYSRSTVMREKKEIYLVWEDVTAVVAKNLGKGETRKLLNRLSGYALPDRIMAIMGPSGSGKSTLLDALAGRLSSNVIMSGNVLLNGKQRKIGNGSISYTTQEDFLFGTLTVKETLTYSAHLRLPSTTTKDEINSVIENTIMKMGLQDCADNKVGNWHLRGLSGGEKRRLSIGLEILTQPYVLFLDEPTSGLDSASALFVIQALKNIALDGRIVVCSIHQPSSYIFDLFDDLCLLSSGETIYFGEAKLAVKFFAEAGFPCPTRRNPSDHFLRCINSDFDKMASTLLRSLRDSAASVPSNFETSSTTEDIKAKLIEKYRSSEYSINTRKKIRQIALINEELMSGLIESRNNWWKQLYTLTTRSFVNMIRDLGYFWVRTLFYILISLGAGIMYFDIGLSNSAFVTRAKCYTYVYDFLICLSVGGLPSFLEEWKVSYHELLNGHYGEAVFMLSNFFASFIFLVIMSLSSGTIVFYMVRFHLGFSHYCYLCMNFFLCFATMESVAMIVALLVPNFLMGIGVSAFAVMFLTMASGLYRPLPDLPKFFWRYPMSYISFTSWAVQGQYKNDMLGLEFEPFVQGEPKIQGKQILHDFFGVRVSYSKWWDLAALLLLLLCHKLLFLSILKYKQRLVLQLRRFCAKRTLKALALRPSFRKEKYGSSTRNQPPHPLSAQEGLASPLS